MKNAFSSLLIFAACVFGFTSSTRGQVIYDNLGSNAPFPTASGLMISGSLGSEFAVRFTAANTLLLDSADLRLWVLGSLTGTVSLLTNGADNHPATVLESATVTFPGVRVDFSPMPLTHAEFSNSVLLTGGTLYWLAVSPNVASPSILGGWDNTGLPFGFLARDTGAI